MKITDLAENNLYLFVTSEKNLVIRCRYIGREYALFDSDDAKNYEYVLNKDQVEKHIKHLQETCLVFRIVSTKNIVTYFTCKHTQNNYYVKYYEQQKAQNEIKTFSYKQVSWTPAEMEQ